MQIYERTCPTADVLKHCGDLELRVYTSQCASYVTRLLCGTCYYAEPVWGAQHVRGRQTGCDAVPAWKFSLMNDDKCRSRTWQAEEQKTEVAQKLSNIRGAKWPSSDVICGSLHAELCGDDWMDGDTWFDLFPKSFNVYTGPTSIVTTLMRNFAKLKPLAQWSIPALVPPRQATDP